MFDLISREDCKSAVSRPGKFEGCPAYVPYLWEIAMLGTCEEIIEWTGGGDDNSDNDGEIGGIYSVVPIGPEEAGDWPQLQQGSYVILWESDQGFVYHEVLRDDSALERFRKRC